MAVSDVQSFFEATINLTDVTALDEIVASSQVFEVIPFSDAEATELYCGIDTRVSWLVTMMSVSLQLSNGEVGASC